jgi:hypothetical protein
MQGYANVCMSGVHMHVSMHMPSCMHLCGCSHMLVLGQASLTVLSRGPGLGNFGAILGRFLGAGGAVLCAKCKESHTAFVSQSIARKSVHETTFREPFSETKLYMSVSS